MSATPRDPSTVDSRLKVSALAGAALLAAGVLLVAVVLPAEYAIDPLGTGARLGLLPLGQTGQQVEALNAAAATRSADVRAVVAGQPRPFHDETVTFTLGPRESVEYKYRLDKGMALLYSWSASVPVNVEFHAEPDGAPAGYAETYEKGTRVGGQSGTLTAPFSGIHGWFWENTTDGPAAVTLKSAGFYVLSHEFRAGAPVKNKSF